MVKSRAVTFTCVNGTISINANKRLLNRCQFMQNAIKKASVAWVYHYINIIRVDIESVSVTTFI